MMRTRWIVPLFLAGAFGVVGCDGGSVTDAGADVRADAAPTDTAADMTVPPDMMQPPPDVAPDTMPPPDMMPPPDVAPDMMPPPDMTPPPDVMPDVAPDVAPDAPPPMARRTATNGSASVITSDDRALVSVNRTANSIAVFSVMSTTGAPPALTRTALLDVPGGEPWAAVVSNDDNSAYVILRRAQQVVRINNLRGTPTLDAMRVRVGSEPTGIAISPTGRKLYVSNWAEGTVSEIDTATMMVSRTIDLNATLAGTALLGTVSARPGLAHPRAIVVTNNGNTDDNDETVYVTEFFSQARLAGTPTDDSAFDVGRRGVVYRIAAGAGTVGPIIYLDPTDDTGFRDSVGATDGVTGRVTGCFPNQLYSATLNNNRLYITALCESPRGPTGPVTIGTAPMTTTITNNFKTEIHPTLYVVDTMTNAERAAERLTLTRTWNTAYTARTVADDGSRRFPLIPNDMAFVPLSNVGYITAYGADAVFRLRFNADGTLADTGSGATGPLFINLSPDGTTPAVPAGRLPTGIAIANAGGFAFVSNAYTRNVTTLQFTTQTAVAATASANAPAAGDETNANNGQRFFVTGLGRWSFKGQAWNSCEACHPDGLTDNVTWFFARGPRQTTSLDGSFDRMGNQRLFNWTAIFDETHDFELNTRGNSGGVGAVVHRPNDGAMPPVVSNTDRIAFDTAGGAAPTGVVTLQNGLNGAVRSLMPDPVGSNATRSVLRDWEDVDLYVRTIRPPRGPNSLNMADVTEGRRLFRENNCNGCHGGSGWTISRRFFTPNETNNAVMGALRTMTYTRPGLFPAALNPPSASGMATLRFADVATAGANDQINCVLRAVGTFPATLDAMQTGVGPAGVRVREVRTDMTTNAQGATGFNPPALVGMATGAPFFHAGNARTLEEALRSPEFVQHLRAYSINALTMDVDNQTRQLVAFLLSIDDDTMPEALPDRLGFSPELCPTM